MSFVTTRPEALSAAACDLGDIGSAIGAQNAAVHAPMSGVLPASSDDVSTLIAAQCAVQAQMYQRVSAEAIAIHEVLVATLRESASSYAVAEAANMVSAG